METYCGKSCAECQQQALLNCPGCKQGPGRQYNGDCDVANCVRSKGHGACGTCGFQASCGKYRGRANVPQYRLKKQEAERALHMENARRAPILGKWLWILFLLFIPGEIAGLMTNDTVAGWFPGLYFPGQILSALTAVSYGLILLKLAALEERYKTAGICALISGAVGMLLALILRESANSAGVLLLSIPGTIVNLVGAYNRYRAHAAVLEGVDAERSEKWDKLWLWHIGAYGAMFASIFLMLLSPVLGALCLMAAGIAVAIIGIVQLVYLYGTAKTFREYPTDIS